MNKSYGTNVRETNVILNEDLFIRLLFVPNAVGCFIEKIGPNVEPLEPSEEICSRAKLARKLLLQ